MLQLSPLYQLESQPGTVQPFRQPSNPVLRPVMGGRYRSCLRNRTPPVPRPENRRKDIRTAVLLLLLRHPGRARLGHCLFYQPDYYLNHFWEMILRKIRRQAAGSLPATKGLPGCTSGTLGLIIALWMYCRKTKMHYMDVLDMIAVATPVTACCIRLANLMNSEIIGKPADVPWAFVFERVDMLPRHPAQLYEAIAYFIFFLGMVYLYRRGQKQQENKLKTDFSTTKAKSTAMQTDATLPYHRGFFFGLCLTEIFVFRFFIEFLKEDQVDFESAMTLNMGQWLSIPFILIGVYFMCFHGKKTAGK